ncbi:hypothetical protein [Hymenobacter sp. IS2118]|uniref:hypothetical protein n=1 Tax=Hymenobacter sp. IS2118 TaxID=1505605 RepID=UPI000557FE34|nr:hypothetical protein [Hymenobacter sp. IS2118]
MASNLDYLDPALIPLQGKADAYLESAKALQRAIAAGHTQNTGESDPEISRRRTELAKLEQEIIALLPTRDEWLKVNLGYGPSRIGAWQVPALNGAPARYELRIVH